MLLGRARSLALSSSPTNSRQQSGQLLLGIDTSRLEDTAINGNNSAAYMSPVTSAENGDGICQYIEQKRDAALAIPGRELLLSYPTDTELAREHAQLLLAHVQCVAELINEAELLTRICQHTAAHPIYQVAHGLESYFGGLIASLSLKLQLTNATMYKTLYSPKILRALEALHNIMTEKESSLQKERATLEERLAIYRDAGSEFQELASAYSAILNETEQVRQDIARVSSL